MMEREEVDPIALRSFMAAADAAFAPCEHPPHALSCDGFEDEGEDIKVWFWCEECDENGVAVVKHSSIDWSQEP